MASRRHGLFSDPATLVAGAKKGLSVSVSEPYVFASSKWFDLFRSGVYLRYAERFLKPEQIDRVEAEKYLA